ncbi:ABC transporter ATP-binding protein [Kocuria sp. cx-455]|uniref:ABC transporter ATP-binding protein n=1 Tax=Kocuria sp. cx-455 TaxID=2771377 RepID=UPI002803B3A5|nr:ABC transporter ATP-binding protein [Kocuria sp. cx-455]
MTVTTHNAAQGTQSVEPVVVAHHVAKHYGDFTAVDTLDLNVPAGEIFGVLGPNGAGKTTLLECLVGLRKPTEGRIRVLGLDPHRDRAEFTTRVAMQPQQASIFESLKVREAIDLFGALYSNPVDTDEILRLVDLEEYADRRITRLSGGQQRRALVGVTLVGRPEVVVLDEPSAGLDPQARRGLWRVLEQLKERGTTVLLTTHHMDEAAAVCDRVAIIVDGRIKALGTPRDLAASVRPELAQQGGRVSGIDLEEVFLRLAETSDPSARMSVRKGYKK